MLCPTLKLAFSYAKFTDDEIVWCNASGNTQIHGYDEIERVNIDVGYAPNRVNRVLNYDICFADGVVYSLDSDYRTLGPTHNLLQQKDVEIVRGHYFPADVEQLLNNCEEEKSAVFRQILLP